MTDWSVYFTYDHETGNLHWKSRPREHFPTDMHMKSWNTRRTGVIAGTKSSYGDGIRKCVGVVLFIGGKRVRMKAHRIIHEMLIGPIPEGHFVDHEDGDPFNNRLHNLRAIDRFGNAQNATMKRFNTSGFKGGDVA